MLRWPHAGVPRRFTPGQSARATNGTCAPPPGKATRVSPAALARLTASGARSGRDDYRSNPRRTEAVPGEPARVQAALRHRRGWGAPRGSATLLRLRYALAL